MSKRRAIEDGGDGAAAGGAEPGLPRFKAVKAAITAALIAGEWTSGAAIPDQARLAGRYRVSIGTLRKAIDELVAESILVRRQGLGTYVAAHGPQRNRFHFFHIVDADGTRAIPEPELIAFTRGRADAQQAAALQVDNGARIYTITNLQYGLYDDHGVLTDAGKLAPTTIFRSNLRFAWGQSGVSGGGASVIAPDKAGKHGKIDMKPGVPAPTKSEPAVPDQH